MTALAQSVASRVRELGGAISPERARATSELYAELHAVAPFAGVEIVRDCRYGPDERHRLDVFVASGGGIGRPVVAFVHGGNFIAGDKRVGGGPFHDNVGVWAARAGYLGVTLTYRLAPAARWPAGREDVALALRWLEEHCGEWGGDPSRIVLVGASAGATHVAGVVAAAQEAREPQPVAGVALLSGMYDLAEFGDGDVLAPYLGADSQAWSAASPLTGLAASDVPVLLGIAEHDPPAHHRQMALLGDALLCRHGRLPHLVYLTGHNHFSEVLHIGTADHLLTDQLSAFIAACAERDRLPQAPAR